MSRDTSTRPEDPDDDAFSDALDDLFGSPVEQGSPVSSSEQQQSLDTAPETHSAGTSSPPVDSPPSGQYYLQPSPVAPAGTGKPPRPFIQTLGMGCATVLILVFVCMVVLMVIGFLSGDSTAAQ